MVKAYVLWLFTNPRCLHDKCLPEGHNWILNPMVRQIRCCLALLLTIVTEIAIDACLLMLFFPRLPGESKYKFFT